MSLETIRQRLETANHGPWCWEVKVEEDWTEEDGLTVHYAEHRAIRASGPTQDGSYQQGGSHELVGDVWHEPDADLIAHAPTDLKLLLAVAVEARRDAAFMAGPALQRALDALEAAP